jgi:hypothetical protein
MPRLAMLKQDVMKKMMMEYRTLSRAVSLMNFFWVALMENRRWSWPWERCWPPG